MDLAQLARLEAHAAGAWPASITRRTPAGWLLRATPGLDRARSNEALPPTRPLTGAELPAALAEVEAFAAEHGLRPGVQVSPLELHRELDALLAARGWASRWDVLVLAGAVAPVARPDPAFIGEDHASDAWLRAWGRCEGRTDVEAHAATVFPLLRGRAVFGRLDDGAAAGICVRGDALAGLFSLAVDPARRRAGLGTRLVGALLAAAQPDAELAYLQVESRNEAAIALYARLGFTTAYTYRHRVGPAATGPQP